VHQHAQRQRTVSGAFALEKRQQRTQRCFHVSNYASAASTRLPGAGIASGPGRRFNYTYG
jgi:hypothetical protein